MHSDAGGVPPRARTAEFLRDFQRALRRESWGRNIIQLAWTAGPVTYLALQGGYLLGYGQSAPHALFVYFGAYTIIAGAVAILVRVIHRATRGRVEEHGTRILRDCLDQLPRLLLAARDQALESYSREDARLLGAKHLLSNPDASEAAVATAVQGLGGSSDLAEVFRRIEVYRGNGMSSRVKDERTAAAADIEKLVAGLRERSPDTAALVEQRSFGRPPSKRRGRVRTEGFIERALAAESEDNARLMSLSDVEEVLTLAIELLVGRSITLVSFDFSGDRQIAEAWASLERARRDFRARLRARNSRLRIVAERLSDRMAGVVPSIARISNATVLRDEVLRALDGWASELSTAGSPDRRQTDAFRRAIAAYRALEQASRNLHRSHAELLSTYRRYGETVGARSAAEAGAVGFAVDGGDGVKIAESEWSLSERRRLAFSREIRRVLLAAGVWKHEPVAIDADAMLGIAVDVLSAAEEHVPLYRPDIQQAIELSRAPTIESLEPGLSPDVRAGWVIALVDQVEQDIAAYAARRVERLVRFHGLKLGPRTRARLVERFGIDPRSLESISLAPVDSDSPWSRPPMQVPDRSEKLRRLADRTARPSSL